MMPTNLQAGENSGSYQQRRDKSRDGLLGVGNELPSHSPLNHFNATTGLVADPCMTHLHTGTKTTGSGGNHYRYETDQPDCQAMVGAIQTHPNTTPVSSVLVHTYSAGTDCYNGNAIVRMHQA